MLSGEIARRYGSPGLPDDTIRFNFTGSAGQSFGAFLAKGVTLDARRRRQRLRRQGAFRRHASIVYPPRDFHASLPEENIIDRQRRALRRDQRRSVLQRHGRRALRGAQLRRDRGGRRRRRSRLRIHDQRPGRRARQLRPQLRRRHERRHRLRARRDAATSPRSAATSTRSISSRCSNRRTCRLVRDLIARHVEVTGSPRAKWILENWDEMLPQFIKVFPHEYKRVLGVAAASKRTFRPVRCRVAGRQSQSRCNMGKTTGFMEYTRELPPRRPVAERVNDWFEIYQDFPGREAPQAGRALHGLRRAVLPHRLSRQQSSFPTGTIWSIAAAGKRPSASLHATNNFPEFTGRICPAPCEASCVLGINEPPVTIKQIEKTIVDRALRGRLDPPRTAAAPHRQEASRSSARSRRTRRRAAAGRAGHSVTVFEKADRIGGLLRYGIPEFQDGEAHHRPPPGADAAEGVKFVTNAHVGVNVAGRGSAPRLRRHRCWPAAPSSRAT